MATSSRPTGDHYPQTGNSWHETVQSKPKVQGVLLDKDYAEHIQKLVCHEIHRIRYRLSAPWLHAGEKDAIEKELWLLTDIEKELNEQL